MERRRKDAKRRALTIHGERIALGETRDLYLPISESYLGRSISIPVRVIRAKKQGPRVFITGTVHGDEISGVGIVRELLFERLPELECGTLICVPAVNVYGLESHSRYLPDRRDLNRCFPGSASGSLSSRLADVVFRSVIKQCDYGIDFHTAAVRRTNYPNVRGDMRDPGVSMLAKAFGMELIVNGAGPSGSLRRSACKAGVPTIILEAGEVWKFEPGVLELGVRGVLNVLRKLHMIAGVPERPLFQVTVNKTTWVRAEHGGILRFHVRPGEFVRKGDYLATNYSIFGREHREIRAESDGIILGMTTMPAVSPGAPVFHLALQSARTLNRIEKELAANKAPSSFDAMREDLATNVSIINR